MNIEILKGMESSMARILDLNSVEITKETAFGYLRYCLENTLDMTIETLITTFLDKPDKRLRVLNRVRDEIEDLIN
jgi:uncharacterized protein YehS (DUF1456 family)